MICLWLRTLDFLYFEKILSYAVVPRLSGEFIFVPVSGVCVFIVLWLVFHNWVYWTRGNFLASRVTYILAFVRLRCVECRAGTSILGRFAGLGGRPVRIFCLLGSVLACVCVIEQVGGWRDGMIFLVFLLCFGGSVQLKRWVGAVFKFSLSSVCC